MGIVPSCYPSKSQRRVAAVTQPYDTRRLLSELITVQTAIVLNEDATNETAMLPPGVVPDDDLSAENAPVTPQITPQLTPQRRASIRESRRRSVEYKITSKTSLGFPGDMTSTTTTTTTTEVTDVSKLDTALTQAVGAHVSAHTRDIARANEEGKKMPSIRELTESHVS